MMKYVFLCLLIPNVVHACDPPFEVAGQGCYYYSADLGFLVDSFDGAASLCQGEGGYLAIVKTLDENTAIVEHFLGASITDDKVLLGARLNEDEVFEWADGTLIDDSFDDWDEDQPGGNGGCMGYSDEHEFEWDDFQCDDFAATGLVVGFICEKPSDAPTTMETPPTTPSHTCTDLFEAVGDGCYYYSSDRGVLVDKYDAAVSLCEADSRHLARVKTGEENTAIVEHFLGASILDDKVLLGATLNDNELFEWNDGTLVEDSFDDWDEDQPSGNGQCMGYSDEHEFEWDDFQCEDFIASGLIVGFICEEPRNISTTTEPTTIPTTETTPTTSPSTTPSTTRPPLILQAIEWISRRFHA